MLVGKCKSNACSILCLCHLLHLRSSNLWLRLTYTCLKDIFRTPDKTTDNWSHQWPILVAAHNRRKWKAQINAYYESIYTRRGQFVRKFGASFCSGLCLLINMPTIFCCKFTLPVEADVVHLHHAQIDKSHHIHIYQYLWTVGKERSYRRSFYAVLNN